MARDFYHNNVREALEKDGWRIQAKVIVYNPSKNEIVEWIK